jgi:hypothetical protein
VVGCPNETPVEVHITFSSAPSVESANVLGRQIARKVLDRIAYRYCLNVQEPGAPSAAFQEMDGSDVRHFVADSATCFISGKLTEELAGAAAAGLKAELEIASLPGEAYYRLFRMALQTQDPVDRFLALYRILAQLYPHPTTRKEDQKYVDDFLEHQCGKPRNCTRPDKPGVKETDYSRLRNEIAHVRPNADLMQTRQEMEQAFKELAEIVRKAIAAQP